MTQQECTEVLQSMGYRKPTSSPNYAKPAGYNLYIVNFKVSDWCNWFMPFNSDDTTKPILYESNPIKMEWTEEKWLNKLKQYEAFTKQSMAHSLFHFRTKEELWSSIL